MLPEKVMKAENGFNDKVSIADRSFDRKYKHPSGRHWRPVTWHMKGALIRNHAHL